MICRKAGACCGRISIYQRAMVRTSQFFDMRISPTIRPITVAPKILITATSSVLAITDLEDAEIAVALRVRE